MFGAETLDHVAFPVRDLPRSEKFYLEVVGLAFLTQRKNADGSARHTYVKAGDNIIGLNLPGIQTEASPSGAPRYAIAIGSEANFRAIVERIEQSGVVCGEIREHKNSSPFLRSFRFTDFDNNHLEICMNRQSLGDIGLSHVVLEATNLERAKRFYSEALGLRLVGEDQEEIFFAFPNHQLLGIKPVATLSDRTKRHGRAVHVAFNVSQNDFDRMSELIPALGGAIQGDARAEDGLRPPGERSIYFSDPDTNKLQITAHGEEDWSLISNEEKWKRIIENRQKAGRGISRFDRGVKPGQ
ncbi:MAG TPA: VOC family protein [Candidatus Binatia bacterium]|nr:VOC family protein [Candidatus Binatia bacterium]